jgi:hypothetical protein
MLLFALFMGIYTAFCFLYYLWLFMLFFLLLMITYAFFDVINKQVFES